MCDDVTGVKKKQGKTTINGKDIYCWNLISASSKHNQCLNTELWWF